MSHRDTLYLASLLVSVLAVGFCLGCVVGAVVVRNTMNRSVGLKRLMEAAQLAVLAQRSQVQRASACVAAELMQHTQPSTSTLH